jgi:uncharacterized protein YqgC (DUF456 family)
MLELGFAAAAVLIVCGIACASLPALPGIPLVYAGIWLLAALDGYRHLGFWWLFGIAAIGIVGQGIDFVAAALGAKRVGASPQAIGGAVLGSLAGFAFGLPGLLIGPFAGAVLGELAASNSVLRSAHVGIATWLGMLLGALVKLFAALTMVVLAAAAWWWNRIP